MHVPQKWCLSNEREHRYVADGFLILYFVMKDKADLCVN